MKKRFLTLLLILSMVLGCLTGCEDTPDAPTKATAAATQTQTETSAYRWYDDAGVRHAALSLGDMPYEMYDIQDFYDLVDELEALAQKPGNETAIAECYQKLLDESCRITTTNALAYIRYMENLTSDYAEDMTTLEDIRTQTSDALAQTLAQLLEGDYADLIRELLGGDDDLVEELEDYTETDEALLSLSKEVSRKVQQYNELTLAQISVTLDGETYTMDSLDEIEEEALYWEVATALGKKENEQLAPILIDLIELYNQTAELSGYDSCAEFAYEGYSRDYTPEDARALHAAVKESIVPVYQEIGELVQNYENPDVLGEIDAEKLMEIVGKYIGTIDADLDLSFRHMSQVGLYSIDYYTGRGDGFTISLPQYNDAAIFMDLVGSDSDLETLVHEFGHPYVKHTTKNFSLRLMDFQAQAYPDARRKTRGAYQLHRGGQSRSPVRPLCNRKQFSCLPPQSKMSWILYAISMRLSGYTSTRSISSSANSVVSVSASKIALDASLRLSCRACSSCFCFACANTAA